MPLLSFERQFAPLVASGDKRMTLRRPRKREFRVGETLYLYSELYTGKPNLLGHATCIGVHQVTIARRSLHIIGHGVPLEWADRDVFARADGLASYRELVKYVERNGALPFHAVLIRWGEIWQPSPGTSPPRPSRRVPPSPTTP